VQLSRASSRCALLLLGVSLCLGAARGEEFLWPQQAPQDWLLAFIDIETTGLTPGYHEMIDIGIVMTDLEGGFVDELYLRLQPQYPERTSEDARAVNAFDERRWRDLRALAPAAAIERIVGFHKQAAAGRKVLMVAFNSHFDAAFLDHLFRSQQRSWREMYHYFVLDLPSMAWSLGLRSLTGTSLAASLGIEDEPHIAEQHTGITGARLNARIYRALLAYTENRAGPQ